MSTAAPLTVDVFAGGTELVDLIVGHGFDEGQRHDGEDEENFGVGEEYHGWGRSW